MVLSHIQSLSSEHFQFCGLNKWPDNHDTQFQINFWAMTIILERIRRKYDPPNRWKSHCQIERKVCCNVKLKSNWSFRVFLFHMRCMSGLALLWCVRKEGFEVNYQCPSCGYRSTSRWYECAQKKCLLYRPVKKRQKATHAQNIPTFFSRRRFSNLTGDFPFGCWGGALPA